MTVSSTAASAAMMAMKGPNHSGFCPVSSLSEKTLVMPGVIRPVSEEITVEITTSAKAAPQPASFRLAKRQMLFGLPDGSKLSPGQKFRQVPV